MSLGRVGPVSRQRQTQGSTDGLGNSRVQASKRAPRSGTAAIDRPWDDGRPTGASLGPLRSTPTVAGQPRRQWLLSPDNLVARPDKRGRRPASSGTGSGRLCASALSNIGPRCASSPAARRHCCSRSAFRAVSCRFVHRSLSCRTAAVRTWKMTPHAGSSSFVSFISATLSSLLRF